MGAARVRSAASLPCGAGEWDNTERAVVALVPRPKVGALPPLVVLHDNDQSVRRGKP